MGQVISVVSGKGGTGKSTFSAGLSYAFAERGNRVLLVDMDIGLRCLDIILSVEDKVVFDIGDVVDGMCKLRDALTPHSYYNELYLLCSPINVAKKFDFKKLIEIIIREKENFDYIILDLPAGVGISVMMSKEVADLVCYITTPDAVSVRDTQRISEILVSAKSGIETKLIINRVSRKTMSVGRYDNIDQIMDMVGVQLIGVIREDPKIIGNINDRKKTEVVKVFDSIANRIVGENIDLIVNYI